MNFSSIRRALLSVVLAGTALTMSAQSFTVHMRDGSTTVYNTADVDSIAFSPESQAPQGSVLFSQPANTYIVSRAGEYEFYPRLNSGKEVEGIVAADWIWATKQNSTDTDQQLISNVSYENGKIRFTASDKEGSAVIAAFNSDNKVVWVWHIWFTDTPEDIEFETGATFMDRAMGATSAKLADGKKTWGVIMYQWGRPVPFFGGYEEEYESKGQIFEQARLWTVMNPDYGFQWKAEHRTMESVEESMAYPTTFFYGDIGNWLNVRQSPNLWLADKTDYDPSPAGYVLPRWEDWGQDFHTKVTRLEDRKVAIYTFNGKSTVFPMMCQNRLYNSGENVIGYPGFMLWNCEYYYYDYLHVLDDPNFPYTKEEAVEMGLIDYNATRMTFLMDSSGLQSVNAAANPSFAIPVRCKKIK